MAASHHRGRESQNLRERLSRLSQASRRINESLDFDQVLQGALDSARSLTSARYGVMTLLDDGGAVEHHLTSGFTGNRFSRWGKSAGKPQMILWYRVRFLISGILYRNPGPGRASGFMDFLPG